MPYFIRLSSFLLSIFILSSCSKDEGVGGNSAIEGRVWVTDVNQASGLTIESYPAKGKRVYIIYGDGEYPSDDIRTNYDGKFKFDFLTEGKYTVYVFSDCDSCAGGETTVLKDVEITDDEMTIQTGDLEIIKLID